MAEIQIYDMATNATPNDDDFFEQDIVDLDLPAGRNNKKISLGAVSNFVAKTHNYTSDLQTTSKTLVGAINELSGAASSLEELSDVDLTTPANGEVLEYNGTSQKWENKDLLAMTETTFTNPYTKKLVPSGQYTEKLKKIIGVSVVWNQLVDTATTSVTITSGHKYIHWNGSTLTKGTSDGTAISVTGGTDKISDLTFMFGSSVADGITAEQFAFLFPNYSAAAYSANTLQSVSLAAKVNKDSADATISTVALDHTALRGLFKLDANNNLYADGDVYNSDGSGSVKMREITITSCVSVGTDSNTGNTFARINVNPVGISSIDKNYSTLISNYLVPSFGTEQHEKGTIDMRSNGQVIHITLNDQTLDTKAKVDTYLTANPLTVSYELGTPTAATLTPYEKLQPIEQGGSEELEDYGVKTGTRDVAIPAGNETAYGDNENMGKIINYMIA